MYTFVWQRCTFLLYKDVHSCITKMYTFISAHYQSFISLFREAECDQ